MSNEIKKKMNEMSLEEAVKTIEWAKSHNVVNKNGDVYKALEIAICVLNEKISQQQSPGFGKWISVDEKVPDEGVLVILRDENGNTFMGDYTGDKFEDNYGYFFDAVKWMVFPY